MYHDTQGREIEDQEMDNERALRLEHYKARIHEDNEQIIVKLQSAQFQCQGDFPELSRTLDQCILLMRAYDNGKITEEGLRTSLICLREAYDGVSASKWAIYDLTHEMIIMGVDVVSIHELLGVSQA